MGTLPEAAQRMALIAATLGCAAMGGIYYAFSGFIMRALAEITPEAGQAAMVSINRVILGSGFIWLFFGSSLLCAGLLVVSPWLGPGLWIAAGAALYLIGMLQVTVTRNVPLNQTLAAAGPDLVTWQGYLRDWTFWNHIRSAASMAAAGSFLVALIG